MLVRKVLSRLTPGRFNQAKCNAVDVWLFDYVDYVECIHQVFKQNKKFLFRTMNTSGNEILLQIT